MENTIICSRCVMDTTDSVISFDDNGVCDHCRTYDAKILPYWVNGNDDNSAFNMMIDKIKADGNGKDFDCIIGMSGGVDSSYLVHLAANAGLNPLVFHVDAGWNSITAVNNIDRLVSTLDLELFTEVIDWQEMQDLQLSYFKSGLPNIDTPQDHAFFATMYKFARKHNVKHILTGGNYSTECVRNPLEWMYYQSDVRQLKDVHRKFGTKALRNFPTTSILMHKVWLPLVHKIKVIRPLDLIRYNKAHAIRTLKELYDWREYPQKHFESRFTKFYESYWLPERFGFDPRRVQFSSLILTGQMTRDRLR